MEFNYVHTIFNYLILKTSVTIQFDIEDLLYASIVQ